MTPRYCLTMGRCLALAAAAATLAACGPARGPGEFRSNFKTSADFVTRMDVPQRGGSPHGTVRIWYSADLEGLLDREEFTAPVGAVAIKEFDGNNDNVVDGYAVMVKREAGYDPEHHDWAYEVRDPQGQVLASPAPGKNPACISCHRAAERTDYLAGTKLSR
jgi:hypothetical protein